MLGILGGTIVSRGLVRENTSLAIDGNRIAAVGDADEIRRAFKFDETIDARGKLVLPGLVDAHLHSFQVACKGLTGDETLLDWLRKYIFPWEGSLTAEKARACARLAYLELIKSGTTTFSDLTSVRHTEEAFKAAKEMGLRANIGKTMMDVNAPPELQQETETALRESAALIRAWHGREGGRLRYMLTPRFDLTCTDELFLGCRRLAEKHGVMIQTHTQENIKEVEEEMRLYGKPAIEHLNELGLLGPRLMLTHCIWLNERELELLRTSGTHVVHTPGSNMILASGAIMMSSFLGKGIPVGLGSDVGAYHRFSIFEQARLACLLQKVLSFGKQIIKYREAFELATVGGAAALNLEKEIGTIEAGKKADLILLDRRNIAFAPANDLFAQIVFAADRDAVETVMVDGRVLMRERQVLVADEQEILGEAEEILRIKRQR
ncbi:MAG: amidohydrolase family protein [Candidatus Micrarchaeia archaeon]